MLFREGVLYTMFFKESDKEKKARSKKKISLSEDSPLNITGGKPITDSYINAFFQLFSVEQIFSFEELYLELRKDIDSLYMSGEIFMRHAKDAYIRYQEYKELDAFQPMDEKGFAYVEASLRRMIKQTVKENQKK